MSQQQEIDQYCRRYKVMGMVPKITDLVKQAEKEQFSYMTFLIQLFEEESLHRQKQAKERLLKTAKLPSRSNLNEYVQRDENGLSKQKLNTLREMAWLDQLYNIMIMGPSGVGKTMLAAGLCADAIEKGYKAYFRTMEDIITMLKTKD